MTVLAGLKWLLQQDLWLHAHHHPDVHQCLVQPGVIMDIVGNLCLDWYDVVMYFSVLVDVVEYGWCLSETAVYL